MSFQALPNGTCVLVGDDSALLAEAAAAARERLGCKVFAGRAEYLMAKHSQGTFDALPLPERCAATMHLLTDLELLAHTDYFVGAPTPYNVFWERPDPSMWVRSVFFCKANQIVLVAWVRPNAATWALSPLCDQHRLLPFFMACHCVRAKWASRTCCSE